LVPLIEAIANNLAASRELGGLRLLQRTNLQRSKQGIDAMSRPDAPSTDSENGKIADA